MPGKKDTKIDDIAAKDGTLTTDGCGLIRESYAKEIRSYLTDADSQTAGEYLIIFPFKFLSKRSFSIPVQKERSQRHPCSVS